MFQYVNRYHAIKIVVGVRQALLAIADASRYMGVVAIDRVGHALPQLDRVVFLRLKVLETQMIPKASTYLQRPRVRPRRTEWIPMIEAQYPRMVCRQPFMEVADPVVLDTNLFFGQAGERLRPLSRGSLGRSRIGIAVSCRINELPLS